MSLSDEARNFNWLLNSFVDQTAGVTDAVAVSSDGLLMAALGQKLAVAVKCGIDQRGQERMARGDQVCVRSRRHLHMVPFERHPFVGGRHRRPDPYLPLLAPDRGRHTGDLVAP